MTTTQKTTQQTNTELVQQAYAAFGKKDIQTILNTLAENVEWTVPGPKVFPPAGTYKGREQVKQFFSRVEESMDLHTFEPREYVAQGDKVVALGYYAGRSKNTGRNYESHWSMVFTFKDGKIIQFREYLDTANLAEAYRS